MGVVVQAGRRRGAGSGDNGVATSRGVWGRSDSRRRCRSSINRGHRCGMRNGI